MTPTTSMLYNHSWHIIIVQSIVFCEIKKMLFVTHAECAASEFDYTVYSHHFFHVIQQHCQAEASKYIMVTM